MVKGLALPTKVGTFRVTNSRRRSICAQAATPQEVPPKGAQPGKEANNDLIGRLMGIVEGSPLQERAQQFADKANQVRELQQRQQQIEQELMETVGAETFQAQQEDEQNIRQLEQKAKDSEREWLEKFLDEFCTAQAAVAEQKMTRNVTTTAALTGALLGALAFLTVLPPDEATPMVFSTAVQCGLAGQVYSYALREDQKNQVVKRSLLVAFSIVQFLAIIQGDLGGRLAQTTLTPEIGFGLLATGLRCFTMVGITFAVLDFAWERGWLVPYGVATKRVREDAEAQLQKLQEEHQRDQAEAQAELLVAAQRHEEEAKEEEIRNRLLR